MMNSEKDRSLWVGSEGHAKKIQRFKNSKVIRYLARG